MTQRILLLCFATLLLATCSMACRAQKKAVNADALIGKWQNPDGNRTMEIYRQGNVYFGRITWVKDKDDKAKPGEIVLRNLAFAHGKWSGRITAAGKEATCSIELPDAGTMSITGKMGLMTRTRNWKRIG